jgi:hypothetical protein
VARVVERSANPISISLERLMNLNQLKELLRDEGVKVSGHKYRVIPTDGLLDLYELLGQIRHYDHEIDIDDTIGTSDYVSTVIHEVMEAINRRYGMDLNHSVITVLEVGFFQFLRDNPVQILAMLEALHEHDAEAKQAAGKVQRKKNSRVTRRRKVSDIRE